MNPLPAFPGLLSAWILGCALVVLLWRRGERLSLLELAVHGGLLGVGAVSLLVGLFGLLLRGTSLMVAVLACIVGVTAFAVARIRAVPLISLWPEGLTPRARWLLLIPAFCALSILQEADNFAFTGDGLFLWEFKARVALDHGGVPPKEYFTSAYMQATHPSYPLALPLADVWLYLCNGGADQGAAQALSGFLYLCICGILGSLTWRFTRNPILAALAAAAPMGVPFLTHGPAGIFRGYVDYPLGACFATALGWILLGTRRDGQYFLAAAFAASLPWWKAEGIIFTAALGFAAFFHFGLKNWRQILLVVAPALLVAVSWKLVTHFAGTLPQDVFRPMSPGALAEGSSRLGVILPHFGKALLVAKNWGFIWAIGAIALVQLILQRRREALTWGGTVCLVLAAFALPYMLTLKDLEWHLVTSANRLLLQLVPSVIIGAAIAARARQRHPEAAENEIGE